MMDKFSNSYQAANKRLMDFLQQGVGAYGAQRNFDLGSERWHENVSLLSPLIRRRVLLEIEVLQAAASSAWSFSKIEKFIQEVYWRIYWKGWLENHPSVWSQWREALAHRELSPRDGELESKAKDGLTGIKCFDHWAQELIDTGYLHNHARMWFASIWIHTLKLDWQSGAQFFYRHLLDGDPASNTLSWRWVAGLQTQGKAYLATASNIHRFTQGRWGHQEVFAPKPVPVSFKTADLVKEFEKSSPQIPQEVDLLIVTTDDLALDRSPLSHVLPKRIVGFDYKSTKSRDDFSNKVLDYDRALLDDALRRLENHYDVPASYGGALSSLAECQGPMVMLKPKIGPFSECQEILTRSNNATLTMIKRDEDETSQRYSIKGFFPFWQHMRKLWVENKVQPSFDF